MGADATRRSRLEELLQLAQAYRGWNRRQLARALGRDASNLVPASGFPKIDLVVELSNVLDWRVEDVVNSFWLQEPAEARNGRPLPEGDFEELESLSRQAARSGRHQDAVDLAIHAGSIAATAEQRAIALTREASAWDGLGRYAEALDASRRGLTIAGVSTDRRLMMQANLANEYYTLWHPVESRSMAHDLIHRYQGEPARNRPNRVSEAFAYYVRGNSCRRLMAIDQSRDVEYAQLARTDLQRAQQLFLRAANDYDEDSYRGVANTCDGGIVETEVMLGRRDAEGALVEITDRLDAIVNPGECASGDWLESYGWWCIYGCNVALRHLDEHRQVQQHLAVLTNKADEIAEITNNWAMRERIVCMQYARRQHFADWTGIETDWTIDTEDVRAIAGTMGRFPRFHATGWKVLRAARIIREGERNGTSRPATKLPR